MPDDRLEKARFVRVSKTGDLVFSLGGREMAVSVDDTLERAILEAKQVRSEMRQAPQPHQQSTLPISQIQSLIRAGADPARVAEKYHLSEMLVRRFSMAVETEKQYAIEQFLAVAAPKDSRVRTISELVEDEKQKLLYVFDYMTERCFFIELSEIITGKEIKGAKCTKKSGEAPKQTVDFEEMAAGGGSLDLDENFYGDQDFDMEDFDAEGFDVNDGAAGGGSSYDEDKF